MLTERIWSGNSLRNFHYLIACPESGEALAVDPLEWRLCLDAARRRGWQITQILSTHEHQDHTGGNAPLKKATGAKVLAHAGAAAVGVDVAEAALRRARAGNPSLDFRLAPIDGPLPLADNSFDLVWASEVIEHVADTARWLSEVRRVLAPGGRFLLTTPSHGRLPIAIGGLERFAEPLGDHLHLYTRRSLESVLAEFGFAEIDIRGAGGLPMLRRLLMARAVR